MNSRKVRDQFLEATHSESITFSTDLPESLSEREALHELDKVLSFLTQTKTGRRSFLAAAPLLLAACAKPSQTRYREGDNTGQAVELTPAEERKLTAEVLPQMQKDYPPVKNAELQNYIRQMGDQIVSANSLEGRPYRYSFSVVDVGMVNAFALPAGTIFVTTPLIAMAETEAELAGVVGHEVGHVMARHTAERMHRQKQGQGKTLAYGAGGGILGGAIGFGLGKLLCPPRDKACLAQATGLGAAAGAGAGLLIRKYEFMAHSREDEMEADRIGFRTAVKAGYSKEHVGDFYEKLLVMEQKHKGNASLLGGLTDALSTHPPSKERVRQMKELEAESPETDGTVSSDQFRKIKALSAKISKRHQKT